jgi:hypothetical protein
MLRKYRKRNPQQHCNKCYSIFHLASCETALLYSARTGTFRVVPDGMQPVNGDNCHPLRLTNSTGNKTRDGAFSINWLDAGNEFIDF